MKNAYKNKSIVRNSVLPPVFIGDNDELTVFAQLQQRASSIDTIVTYVRELHLCSAQTMGVTLNYNETENLRIYDRQKLYFFYDILSSYFRFFHKRLPLLETDSSVISDAWFDWLHLQPNKWFYGRTKIIYYLFDLINEEDFENQIRLDSLLLSQVISFYGELEWVPSFKKEMKNILDFQENNVYEKQPRTKKRRKYFCKCEVKGKKPCNQEPCATEAYEAKKKGILLY